MKHSIKYKLPILIIVIMTVAIALTSTFGTAFIEKYYILHKKDVIVDVYNKMAQVVKEDKDLSESDNVQALNDECENAGVTIIMIDSSGNTIYEYGAGKTLQRRWQEMIYGAAFGAERERTIIEKNDNYTMQRARDLLSDQEYYELFGTLDSGYYFVIRVSVQNMRETLNITNKFYLILLISMTVVMTIMMIIVTRRYTDPILELATISTRMSNLDFDAKYTGKHKDEIGVLGNSMNELSAKLEGTILELKKANIELQKDIEQKIEIDEMRKDFISNVSHELKTPIALIQGYAEGLKDNINDDPESMEFYCDVIIDESDKMNKMVKKLLALTQIEFGNKQVNIERFNLVDVMEGIIKSVQLRAEQENVKIIFENKEPVYVWADEFQIEEVITNYVSNAFNHIDGKRIIEMKIVEKDGIVRMSVFNTGKQIPENELENVWIKFYKVDKARTREYGGNGIGLSIVKAIADSMNKKCGVFNHEDGVEFWFELDGKASEEGLEYDSNN